MDTNDILKATQSTQRLVQDKDYYKFIFKKTERIVSVVFYITHNLKDNEEYKSHIDDIEHTAREVHNAVLRSLEARAHTAEDVVRDTAHALIALESKLRIGQVAGMVAPEVLQVLVAEIDTVMRGINKYLNQDEEGFLLAAEADRHPVSTTKQVRQKSAPAAQSGSGDNLYNTVTQETAAAQKQSRQDRILTVIEARGEATIKDISEVVNDVSEKTIQRELNTMINDNKVKRHGERRWSKYSIF